MCPTARLEWSQYQIHVRQASGIMRLMCRRDTAVRTWRPCYHRSALQTDLGRPTNLTSPKSIDPDFQCGVSLGFRSGESFSAAARDIGVRDWSRELTGSEVVTFSVNAIIKVPAARSLRLQDFAAKDVVHHQ